MKPLSAILAFIGLTVLAVLIAGWFVKKSSSRINNVMYCLDIGDPSATPTPTYVPLKKGVTIDYFDQMLKKVKDNKGKCDITYLDTANGTADPKHCDKVRVTLKTDRVIKSELASNRGPDSSAANDPNVMHHVASPEPTDITAIAAPLGP